MKQQHRKKRELWWILCWTSLFLTTFSTIVTIYVAAKTRTVTMTSMKMTAKDVTTEGASGSRQDLPSTTIAAATWDLQSLVDRFVDWPSGCDADIVLLVLVTSAPDHFDRRQAIRETWGSSAAAMAKDGFDQDVESSPTSSSRSRTVFLVGRPPSAAADWLVYNEMSVHGDVLLGDYVDTYRNLTLKMLHGLLFAHQACGLRSKFYVLKTDDDCFVNVSLLVDFLLAHGKRRLYVGRIQHDSRVVRSPQSKWYVPTELYQPPVYPPYASGIGYVLSSDLVEPALDVARSLPPFPNEDAYVGALMTRIGVRPVHSARFVLHGHRHLTLCNYRYVMVVHRVVAVAQQRLLARLVAQSRYVCPAHQDPALISWR